MAPSRSFIVVPFLLLGRRLSPPLKRGWRASSARVPLPLALWVGGARGGAFSFGGRCLSSPAALRSRASVSHRPLTFIALFHRGPCSSHRPLTFIAWCQRVARHPADFQPSGCRATRWHLLVVTLLPTGSSSLRQARKQPTASLRYGCWAVFLLGCALSLRSEQRRPTASLRYGCLSVFDHCYACLRAPHRFAKQENSLQPRYATAVGLFSCLAALFRYAVNKDGLQPRYATAVCPSLITATLAYGLPNLTEDTICYGVSST